MNEISIYPPTLDGTDTELKRQEIREYFHNTYTLFEKMFEVLKDESVFYKKSEPTRHPMIFYFGHTATFFVNKLFNMKIISKRIDAEFESTFAVGVDEMAWDDLNSDNYRWPSVDEVRVYRKKVRDLVDKLIMTLPLNLPIKEDSGMWIILMGIEHERIHIETSSVLHRQMPLEFIQDVEEFKICDEFTKEPINEMLDVASWHLELGKDKTHNLYGWDNEYGTYSEDVESFKASKYLVSNAEFMEFVEDNGYERDEFWDDEGKRFLKNTKAKHPPFWHVENNEYFYRTLTSLIHMPRSWAVDVNALEAMAFCRWKSKKDGVSYTLPSEAEYMALYEQVGLGELPDDTKANLNFKYFSSSAVDKFMFGGFGDVVGNVWQWSRTPIFGFDGFEVHEAYDDFSIPTFDDKHALILGSSWASSGNLIMKHSRYAFRRHFYQHAGFRYVISNPHAKESSKEVKLQADILQNMQLHYDSDFIQNTTKIAIKYADKTKKALDLACGVGRGSFELASVFDEVEGVDFSARFIKEGIKKLKGDEGLSFWQGDARNLKPNFNSYDLILFTNLKERFVEPKHFLDGVKERLNVGGVLLIVMPKGYEFSCELKFLHSEDLAEYVVSVYRYEV